MSDDKIAEIRERHAQYCRWGADTSAQYRDRAFLLAEVERLTRERDEALAGIERLRKDLRQGFPIRYETVAGCMCPANANLHCQNSFCPRRNPPGVTCYGGNP